MMSGVWEGGCEKEGVMMLKARDFGNHEEARRMKVGNHNIMNQPTSQGEVKSTFVGKWRQDLQVVVVVAVQGGRTHKHGEWEVVGGGQAKVLRLVGIRGLGI
jgi:hypothetical protein